MKDPRDYLEEIRQNLRKIQSQQQVTPTENALFGMVDGLAGLHLTALERITRLEQQLADLQGRPLPPVASVDQSRHPAV